MVIMHLQRQRHCNQHSTVLADAATRTSLQADVEVQLPRRSVADTLFRKVRASSSMTDG